MLNESLFSNHKQQNLISDNWQISMKENNFIKIKQVYVTIEFPYLRCFNIVLSIRQVKNLLLTVWTYEWMWIVIILSMLKDNWYPANQSNTYLFKIYIPFVVYVFLYILQNIYSLMTYREQVLSCFFSLPNNHLSLNWLFFLLITPLFIRRLYTHQLNSPLFFSMYSRW
jgi:hypothetical protein